MKALKIIIPILMLLTSNILLGQISVSGVVNTYYPVSSISGSSITVGAGSGATHTLAIGDKVLLIQMTGNTSANGGKFEYANVTAVSGTTITVDGISRSYTPSTEKVQLVWVPYSPVGITVTTDVTAMDWNGTVGGVISIFTDGSLILNGNVSANGAGFDFFNTQTITGSNIWYGGGGGSESVGGGGGGGGYGEAGKGGIFPFSYSGLNGTDGTLNGGISQLSAAGYSGGGGGGGGVGSAGSGGASGPHGGGGGGGAGLSAGGCGGQGGDTGGAGGQGSIFGIGDTNGMGGNVFTVFPSTVPNLKAGGGGGGGKYIGGGGGGGQIPSVFSIFDNGGLAGSNGGGGGNGGTSGTYSGGNGGGVTPVSYNNFQYCDASANCPDPRVWMAGGSRNVKGGGIALINANTIITNNKIITANGDDGTGNYLFPSATASGGAGGGGGGIVVLNSHTITGVLQVCAKGGKGGEGLYDDLHGGGSGGGGGGGVVWVNDPLGGIGDNITGVPPIVSNISFCVESGNPGASVPNPKNSLFTGSGGCGGAGTIQVNPNCSIFENCTASCTISSITATPSTCAPATNTYSVSGQVTFTDAPATGTLTVSIGAVTQTFNAPFTSPQAYTLTGLTSDGASHTVTATFSADASCTASQTYTAPASCQCIVSTITATAGVCDNNNNTYSLSGQVSFTNAPTTGTLVITVTGGNSVTLNAPFTSPISYNIGNLNADGASHTVSATFSANITCTQSANYTAPTQCSTPCPPSSFDFCSGDMFTLTAPAGYSSYQWYTVVGATETPISGATSNIYVATMPGTYIYHATDAGGCPIELCCPVTLNDVRPLLSCTALVIPGCGQSNGLATVSATGGAGGYTYTWSTTPAQTTATATGLSSGTYTVTVVDSGSCSNTCSVVLAAPNSPTCVANVVTQPGCGLTNGSATVTPSGGNGVYTYKWSTTPQQSSQTATNLGAGLYTVTVTDGNMCTSTCTVTLTTPSGPTCSIAAFAQPSCANLTGGSATVTGAGGSGGYTYRWSTTPQQTAATATGLSGGTYTVTITDSNSCTSTCQIIMTTPTNCCNVNAVTIQNIECYDNATPALMTDNKLRASLLVTNSNASLTTYNVTVNGGTTITPTSGTYGIGTQFTLGPGTAGGGSTFTVTITDSANPGCQNTVQLVDPGTCYPGTGVCPPVKCGTATIQVNGN